MAKSSALARVIGLTRAFSLERGHHEQADDAPVAAALADDGAAAPMAGQFPVPDADPPAIRVLPPPMETGRPGVVLAFPALAQVTIVPGDSAPPEGTFPAGTDPAIVTAEAIDAIEADIASLLATLDRVDGEAPEEDEEGEPSETDAEEPGDEPVAALLSELNRLWQSEPGARRFP